MSEDKDTKRLLSEIAPGNFQMGLDFASSFLPFFIGILVVLFPLVFGLVLLIAGMCWVLSKVIG